jgi:peptidoglycan hydrolase-like protein with peptidoglycan-binding domain
LKLFKKETQKMSSSIWKGVLAIAVLIPALTIASAAQAMLKLGDRGGAVRDLQERLDISADGVYGPDTEAAVLQYQAFQGLTQDGIAGAETLSSLGLDPNSQPDVRGEVFSRAPGGSVPDGPYRVVVPGTDPDLLGRTRAISPGAEIVLDADRGDYIDAGGYSSRSDAEDLVRRLQDRNLEARVDFQRG